jgi:hypothetical protein
MLDRTTLENAAIRLLGASRETVRGQTDRQIGEALLRKLSPLFSPAGRTDTAISAAVEYALFESLRVSETYSAPTTHGPGEIPGTVDNFFKAQGVPTISSVTQRPDSIDAQLRALEEKRLNAWKPKPPPSATPSAMPSPTPSARRADAHASIEDQLAALHREFAVLGARRT